MPDNYIHWYGRDGHHGLPCKTAKELKEEDNIIERILKNDPQSLKNKKAT